MYFDGSLMKTRAGAGLLFISPLVNGLQIAIELGVRRLDIRAIRSSSSIKS